MNKKYVLGGSIIDSETSKGIEGLRVEIWDKNSNSKTAMASTFTDEKGEFKFTVDDSKPDVYFEVFEDNAKIYSTENKLIRSLKSDKMDIKIPIDSSIIIGKKKLLKAEGYVYHIDTNPVSSINVVVSEKNIEKKIQIAKAKTDSKGYYEIDFYSNQLKLNPKNPALLVEVQDETGKTLVISDLILNPSKTIKQNFIIDNANYAGLSKFESTMKNVQPHIGTVKYSDLVETRGRQDITFLSGQSGKSLEEVNHFVQAHKISEGTDIPAEVFYGFLKLGYPEDLNSVLSKGSSDIEKTFNLALEENLIPQSFKDRKSGIMNQFNNIIADKFLNKKPDAANSSLGDILKLATEDTSIHKKMIILYNSHTGSVEEFWQELKLQIGQENEKVVNKIQHVLKLSVITGNQYNMVKSLIKTIDEDNVYKDLRVLAKWDEEDWQEHIKTVSLSERKLCIPANIEGNDNEKINKYAEIITEMLHEAYPTAAFAGRLDKDNSGDSSLVKVKIDLQKFLASYPDFDFNKNFISLQDDRIYKLNNINDKEGLTKEIKSIQRLFKFTTNYYAILAHKKDKLDSAYKIVAMTPDEYINKYSNILGGEYKAKEVYEKAENVYMSSLELLVQSQSFSNIEMTALPSLFNKSVADADLRTMFGSLEQWNAEQCHTVYSPAAYLVDILNFLEKRAPENVYKELIRRRGDIPKIKLTCKNTETPMPYIDLVIEQLENLVLSKNGYKPYLENYQTKGSAKELAANPEYYNKEAYDILKKELYPQALPFNFPMEESRIYLKHLGISRAELIKDFMPFHELNVIFRLKPGDISNIVGNNEYFWAIEFLGLTPEEASVIIEEKVGSVVKGLDDYGICSFYGFNRPKEFGAIVDPGDSQNILSNKLDFVQTLTSRVDVFLQQTGLEYIELLYLLNTNFINPVVKDNLRKITIVSTDKENPATCVLKDLCIQGMDYTDLRKVYKFIRLWRKLGWSMIDLDKALTSLSIKLIKESTISHNNREDLIKLAYAASISERLNITISEVLPFWNTIDTSSYMDYKEDTLPEIPSMYDTLFRNKAVINPLDTAFNDILSGSSIEITGHEATILAALQIGSNDFNLLIDYLKINELNKAALDNLYRNTKIAKALNFSINDYIILKSIVGDSYFINAFDNPRTTNILLDIFENLSSSKFSADEMNYILKHVYSNDSTLVPKEEDMTAFFKNLVTALGKVQDKETRKNIVIQKFAEILKISPETATMLMVEVIKSKNDSNIFLIEDFIKDTFANSSDIDTTISEMKDYYILLGKIGLVLNKFKIADSELEYILKKNGLLKTIDLSSLPVKEVFNADFTGFENLIYLIMARDTFQHGSIKFFDIVECLIDDKLTTEEVRKIFLDQMEACTQWGEALKILIDSYNVDQDGGVLKASFAEDFIYGKNFLKIKKCMDIKNLLGLTIQQIYKITKFNMSNYESQLVKNAAKSKYNEDKWYEVAKPLRDVLREKQRDALTAYVVAHPDKSKGQVWKNSNELYEYLLIDVEMCSKMMTSRIKQAISSVQLFVDRVLLSVEHPNMDTSQTALKLDNPDNKLSKDSNVKEWKEWRKLYRIWEANRKIFLYPENWIEPELRDDKSPFFKELETQLLQNEVNSVNVEDALHNYLEKLDAVARLEIKCIYHEKDENVDIIHVVGRTFSNPHKYYYRKFENDEWSAWEKIELDIDSEHIGITVWNRRLHIFWLVLTGKSKEEETISTKDNEVKNIPSRYYNIQLAWSELKRNKWTPKRISKSYLNRDFGVIDNDTFERKKEGIYILFETKEDRLCVGISERVYAGDSSGLIATLAYFNFFDSNSEPYTSVIYDCYIQSENYSMPVSTLNSILSLPNNTTGNNEMLWGNGTLYLQKVYGQGNYILNGSNGKYKLVTRIDSNGGMVLMDAFFYQDNVNTFFVKKDLDTVADSLSQDDGSFDIGKIIDIINDIYYYDINPIPDPVGPIEDWRNDPSIINIINETSNPIDKETNTLGQILENINTVISVNSEVVLGSQINIKAISSSMEILNSKSQAMTTRMLKPKKKNDFNNSDSNFPIVEGSFHNEERYTFYNFNHNHVKDFIQQLNLLGIDGMLTRNLQSFTDTMSFESKYQPNVNVVRHTGSYSYPDNTVDFNYGGAYSQYNWELFFHVPILIASRLSSNQQFEDAQKWFHYIFNPTNNEDSSKKRFWQFKRFYDEAGKKIETLDDLMKNVEELSLQVNKWAANPFKPHVIARMRILAYMKNVVMKYIDNLIAWGDQLFARDTIESINEATQLYVLAAKILGERPEKVPQMAISEEKSFDEIDENLDAFSNVMVNIEGFIQPLSSSGNTIGKSNSLGKMAYFSLCQNEKLIGYWDKVADRLFKIRHCMNIEGVARELPLFDPPIDPGMLVKAAAAGMSLSEILSASDVSLPNYRFSNIIQKANEICADVKSLGNALLTALEKKDAEDLALIRQVHEGKVLDSVRDVKQQQITEAKQQIETLIATKAVTQAKYNYYSTRPFMNNYENQYLQSLQTGMVLQAVQGGMETLSSVLSSIPNFKVGCPTTIGATYGGANLGAAMKSFSSYLGTMISINNTQGSMVSALGGYNRRNDDWKFQTETAKKELDQIDKQILAAQIRLAISEKELKNQDLQIENSKELDEFMRSKYTNKELYEWMIGQISTVYFQSYQMAYDLAKRAERCYQYELGLRDNSTSIIQYGYWDSLRKGLLSAEKLQYDIRRLEIAYIENNKRNYELTKHISLALLNPLELIKLKNEGICSVYIPEELFDFDYPGHYARRIKTISISIPCVAGPYTTINCTLRLKNHVTRVETGGTYVCSNPSGDSRFIYKTIPTQSIVTSAAQNDSGMFEINFKDEQYLPFEGCGAISEWEIELCKEKELRQFDYNTISDIIIHMKYTAIEAKDGDVMKNAAMDHLKDLMKDTSKQDRMPLLRVFSCKHEFPTQWYKFMHGEENTVNSLELTVDRDKFPFYTNDRNLTISSIDIIAKCKFDSKDHINSIKTKLEPGIDSDYFDTLSDPNLGENMYHIRKTSSIELNKTSEKVTWTLLVKAGDENSNLINDDNVEDIFIVFSYKLN